MSRRSLLPLADYQRIYQVGYSVLEASGIPKTHRAFLFFATVGMLILREHYRLAVCFAVKTSRITAIAVWLPSTCERSGQASR